MSDETLSANAMAYVLAFRRRRDLLRDQIKKGILHVGKVISNPISYGGGMHGVTRPVLKCVPH